MPDESGADRGKVGELAHWLYVFRPAAQAWEGHYSANLEAIGFSRGQASPVAFWNREKDIALVVHGDDFTFVSDQEGLDFAEEHMKKWYEVKVKARLGQDEGDDREVEGNRMVLFVLSLSLYTDTYLSIYIYCVLLFSFF